MEGSVVTVVGRVVAAGTIVAASIALGGSAQAAVATDRFTSSGQTPSLWRTDSSGQITAPSDGQVVSDASVTVSARTGLVQLNMGLYVDGPSTSSQKVAGGGANQTISGTFAAGDAPNGTFTVTLKGEITGTSYATSTFKLRRPAEAPGNVNASRQGTEKVLVTWSRGTEPDLQSYEVSNTQSGVVGRLPADSACSGSSCKAVLAVPAKAVGQKVGFTVKAFRGDGDGGSVESGDSAAAYISFPAVTSARPTKKKTTTDQATKNRDAKSVDALPTLPAKKQALPSTSPTRKSTTTKLPDIPDADSSGNLPIPTADEQGENGELVPADAKDGADSAPVQSDGVKAQSSESPIGNIGQYGLYVAGGILLLLLGAHAGAWARRRALSTAGPGAASVTSPPGDSGTPAQAANANRGAQAKQETGSTPTTTAPPRRPAVILAVAKTRVPEPASPSRAEPSGPEGGAPSSARVERPGSADGVSSSVHVERPGLVEGVSSSARAERWASGYGVPYSARAERPRTEGRPPISARAEQPGSEDGLPNGARGLRTGWGAEAPYSASSGRPVSEAESLPRSEESLSRSEESPGAVHIALPSSAVTEVPETSAPIVTPAVRLEERWDDYLPPSPRSMEDSGFWERPQPGVADFWAADEDDGDGKHDGQAYAGRRHRGGES
ncbi:hypothetical protein [Nonomuraea insulae]|uniref:Fibronectin type-III domain-containing protein n=1 Tax=Nonomuraea insulae TaxID=1616787 RepID=A0ABW1D0V4_9ACTN